MYSNKLLIIGAGRIGTSLFNVINDKTNYSALLTDIKSANQLQLTPVQTGYFISTTDINHNNIPKLIFITVPDDKISEAVDRLLKFKLSGNIIIHTSGANSTDVLLPLKSKKCYIGSFHPLQTFSKPFCPPSVWKGIYSTYQGDEEGYNVVHELADIFQINLIQVTKEQKLAIHISVVIASNLYFSLLTAAEKVLNSADMAALSKQILIPIINQTIKNYQNNSINEALTGPLKRGDLKTLQHHLNYLSKNTEVQQIYTFLSKRLLSNPEISISNKSELEKLLYDYK